MGSPGGTLKEQLRKIPSHVIPFGHSETKREREKERCLHKKTLISQTIALNFNGIVWVIRIDLDLNLSQPVNASVVCVFTSVSKKQLAMELSCTQIGILWLWF